jgi:spore coat protein U-like protein
MSKLFLATLSAGSLIAAVGSVEAATTTTTFNVSATVAANCLASATALNFGTYTPAAGNVISNTTVSVRCTRNTAFTVALNGGSTTGGTISQRLLTDGSGNSLQYNLYRDAAFTLLFGDGTTGTTAGGTGNGMAPASAVAVSVYGQLPDTATNQSSPAGTYTDVINVTVTY